MQGQYGRFFGQSASPGAPVIVPSRARRLGQPNPAEGGDEVWRGFNGCLGDVTDLEMMVVSSLPAPFDVGDLTVVLSIMQVGQNLTQDLPWKISMSPVSAAHYHSYAHIIVSVLSGLAFDQ